MRFEATWDPRVDGWRVGARPDGRAVWVCPFMFTQAIIVGPAHDVSGYDDRWCYETRTGALAAARAWLANPDEPEPDGWHRHPTTGRRRPDGDPAREHVER